MINRLGTRPAPSHLTTLLNQILPILNNSGIAERLTEEATRLRPWTGQPYTATGVLATLWLNIHRGTATTIANILRTIFEEYTPQDLHRLGLHQINPVTPDTNATPTTQKATNAAYMSLYRYIDWLLTPIDDTPFRPGTVLLRDEATRLQHKALTTFATQTALRDDLLNNLIDATIDRNIYPNGSSNFLVDEHVIHTALSEASNHRAQRAKADPAGHPPTGHFHAGIPMATYYPKQRRTRSGWHIGLTRLLSCDPDPHTTQRLPEIAFSILIRGASAGTSSHMLNCLDHAQKRALVARPGRKARRLIIADQGYTKSIDANYELLKRDFYFLMRYAKDATTHHDLSQHVYNQGDHPGPGPSLHLGQIVCPAAAWATSQGRVATPTPRSGKAAHAAHAKQQEYLTACAMPINGPTVSNNAPPGRRAANAPDPEPRVKIKALCPAAAGRARCPARPETLTDPALQGMPLLRGESQADLDNAACSGEWVTITLTPHEYKQWQPLRAHSKAHEARMSPFRSRDEAFNAELVSPHSGGQKDRAVQSQKNPWVCLQIAFAVATTNLNIQQRYRDQHLDLAA